MPLQSTSGEVSRRPDASSWRNEAGSRLPNVAGAARRASAMFKDVKHVHPMSAVENAVSVSVVCSEHRERSRTSKHGNFDSTLCRLC